MNRVSKPSMRQNIKLVIISRNREAICKIIKKYSLSKACEDNINLCSDIYRLELFQEITHKGLNPLVSMLDGGPNIWIYEYHLDRVFIINNYQLETDYTYDITKTIEVKYCLSNISHLEAINIILREQLSKKNNEVSKQLLKMEETVLYKSILRFLFNQTGYNSGVKSHPSLPPLKRAIYTIYMVITRLSKCKDDINQYGNLEYKIFMKVFN